MKNVIKKEEDKSQHRDKRRKISSTSEKSIYENEYKQKYIISKYNYKSL
jgi:hypothetical protein